MIEIELTDEEFGQRGGTYYYIENEYNKLVRVSDISPKIAEQKVGRGKRNTYKLRCPENITIYEFQFSSNVKNRNLNVHLHNPIDFLHDKHQTPIRSFHNHNEIANRYIEKFQLSNKIKDAILEYRTLRPLIKDFVGKNPKEWLNAPPATEEAINNPSFFIVSALSMSKRGAVPRPFINIIKYFKQLYELKAVIDGFDAKVEKLDISRRGSFFPYNAPNLDVLPLKTLQFLQITFSNPSCIIQTENDYYTIWYEFSLTKDIRPDFFILKGKHESPFNEKVHDFLSSLDYEFCNKVINQWKRGFFNKMFIDAEIQGVELSRNDIKNFLINLATYLKSGLVIESKESRSEFYSKNTKRQLDVYPKIFHNQRLLLLSWANVPSPIDGFDIIDNFKIDVDSTRRLTQYLSNVLG